MRPRVVEIVLRRCLGHTPGEAVLVVTDPGMESVARAFQREALSLGIEAALVCMPLPRTHGQEPPASIAEALKAAPVAVLLTSESLIHTGARRVATERHRVRIASMARADAARLERLLDLDYEELRARTEELARLLEGGRRVRLTTPAGTDLSFEIGGRTIIRECGELSKPGAFADLPAGEVCLAPLEGTAKGILRVDGSIGGLGPPPEPMEIRFRDGRAEGVVDARLREILEPFGPEAFQLAEFGIGTNPRAVLAGNLLEDEKALGTAHVALGSNRSMGGRIDLPIHVDLVVRGARVEVDGRPVPERFLLPLSEDAAAADLPAPLSSSSELYATLFQHSNDAQYLLDLDSQRFLEVNGAFERLIGYTRAELLSVEMTVARIIARDSIPLYHQKRELRRILPSERYDLRFLSKSGEKRPVELSVRRLTLEGRTVVVGVVRDLTHRKKIEREMWKKIEELGHANSRIYALTEKIRRVPEITPQLLNITQEEELLERTGRLLCARGGLGYSDVNIHLLRPDGLELVHSTIKTRRRKLGLDSDHRLVRVVRGEDAGGMTHREAVLPLKGRDRNIGVLEVFFHPKEIEVLQDNERALKAYLDLLETLSNIVGLLVDNLQLYESVHRQSILDPLTGVYNRRYFDAKLSEEVVRASRYHRDLTLLMIDIDHFAKINNSMGHEQGDRILCEMAEVFRAHTREADTVGRYGGDEFVILLPETTYAGAMAKAEILRKTVSAKDYSAAGPPLRITLSIGVTAFRPAIKSGEEFMRSADAAMYAAKRSGRDTVVGAADPAPADP